LEAVVVGLMGPFLVFLVYSGITKQYGKDKLVFFLFACAGGLFLFGSVHQIFGVTMAKINPNEIRTVFGPLSQSGSDVQGSSSIKISEKSFFVDGLNLTVNESKRSYFRVPGHMSEGLNQTGGMAAVTYSDRFKSLDGRPFVIRFYRCR
jgi:hypothetical protein